MENKKNKRDDNIISIKNLTKKYGSFTAVDNLTLDIKRGEIVGLIGHNGAGKTTTFVMLTGLTSPTSGSIVVDGVDIAKDPIAIKENIGFLPDGTRYYTELSARENLEFFCDLADTDKSKIDDILKVVMLDKFEGRPVGEFSKGMIQRVGIAQALIKNPKLIILDEPTSGIDPEGRVLFNKLLRDLNKKGISILVASHSLDEVQQVCDRIVIIRDGKMIAYDSFSNLINNGEKSPFVLIESYDDLKLKKIIESLKFEYDYRNGLFKVLANEVQGKKIFLEVLRENVCLKSFCREKLALSDVFMGYYKRK